MLVLKATGLMKLSVYVSSLPRSPLLLLLSLIPLSVILPALISSDPFSPPPLPPSPHPLFAEPRGEPFLIYSESSHWHSTVSSTPPPLAAPAVDSADMSNGSDGLLASVQSTRVEGAAESANVNQPSGSSSEATAAAQVQGDNQAAVMAVLASEAQAGESIQSTAPTPAQLAAAAAAAASSSAPESVPRSNSSPKVGASVTSHLSSANHDASYLSGGSVLETYAIECEDEVIAEIAQEGPWSPGMSPEIESITLTPSPSSTSSPTSESEADVLRFRNGGFSPSPSSQDLQWSVDVNSVACFYVAVNNDHGEPFDERCRQRAFFTGLLAMSPHPHVDVARCMQSEVCAAKHVLNVSVPVTVTYNHTASQHQACFALPVPGTYTLYLFLLFTNAYRIMHEIEPSNVKGLARALTVLQRNVTAVAAPDFSLTAHRSSLPSCTFATVTSSGNYGFWMDLQWLPYACQLSRLSLDQVFSCLHGKNLLMIGDSQMRFTFAAWMEYLSADSQSHFFETLRREPWKHNAFKINEGYYDSLDPPIPRGSKTGAIPQGDWQIGSFSGTYYGMHHSGFTKVSPHRNFSGANKSFHLTFSTKMGISGPIFPPWKLNKTTYGDDSVFNGQRFDLVVAGTMLHDVLALATPNDFRDTLSKSFLPDLHMYLSEFARVTLFGPWAVMESPKPQDDRHKSNNVRAAALSQMARSVNGNDIIPLLPATSCRPDLSLDSVHYPMQVSIAMLNIWLSNFCDGERR